MSFPGFTTRWAAGSAGLQAGIRCVRAVLCLALVLAGAAYAEDNLVVNGDFESLTVDQPDQWKVFVSPAQGASGTYSSTAHGGQFSVMLHTPTPYAKEPVNNWSQNIVAEMAGQTLQVSGWIKTEGATEAALWLQCWRRAPWGVLKTHTTSAETPMYGNREWEAIRMTAEIPEGTDFLTLRCVLLGTGTAWFDDIEVQVLEQEAPEVEGEGLLEPAQTKAQDTGADATALFHGLEAEIARMREANLIMAEALQQVREDNAALLAELDEVQAELAKVRQASNSAEAGTTPAALAGKAPPIVPHGMDWRTLE
ncbi:MAG: hypothetical protein HYV27_14065 [Candidatus Hydrogenedentes bacterium]|nr:hypothetical protein [Candidatus Hydrogenedentota bacterium]